MFLFFFMVIDWRKKVFKAENLKTIQYINATFFPLLHVSYTFTRKNTAITPSLEYQIYMI